MKKVKTKFLTRITTAAVLFAFCANPVCYAAYSYNVSEGANGEIIVGGKTSAEQEKKEGNSMKDDNIQNNTGNFIPQQTENTDSENTSSSNTHGLNEYIERAEEIIDWFYEDSLEYDMSAFTATDMAEEVDGVQIYMVPEGITTTRVKIPWYNNNYIIFDIRKTFDDNYFCSEFNSENKYVGMVLFRNNSLIECLVNSDKTCSVKTFGFFPDDLFDEQADVPFFLFDRNKKLLMF